MSDLLDGFATVQRGADLRVQALCSDSRQVRDGSVFIAARGLTVDARDFIPAAVEAGAAGVIYDDADGFRADADIPTFAIENLGSKVGEIASRFYGRPSSALTVIALTGTNGKTTCAWLLAGALRELGSRCGLIGTLGVGLMDSLDRVGLTTPDAVTLHADVAQLRDVGADHVAIEVSSHALDQDRASGLTPRVAVFTNLSQDHLDYHGTMASYGAAKARLFDFDSLRSAVVNTDDSFGATLVEQLREQRPGLELFDIGVNGRLSLQSVVPHGAGIDVVIREGGETFTVRSTLIGDFNGDNIASVFGVLRALGYAGADAAAALSSATAAPGRMERFVNDARGVTAIVDFAHTPDALAKALDATRQHTQGDLWCVFGCGGDRDRGKRSQMGEVAAAKADHIIVTNDNPRTEDPAAIANDICSGIAGGVRIELDRRAAVESAITNAGKGDVVLIAGKGHEATQTVGGDVIRLSDRELVETALERAA